MSASSVSVKVITWEGAPSVEKASALREELMLAFSGTSQIVVSLSLVDSIDLAIIQLLKAARLEADATGKTFHLTGSIKPDLARAFFVAGFLSGPTDNAKVLEAELFDARYPARKEQ
jgi:anti-anti-sigma regulatory factor